MPAAPDTGNLAIATFTNSGFTSRIRVIGELDRTIAKLEASALDTDGDKEYIADDLGEPGELEIEFYWDPVTGPPAKGVVDVITVTFPPHPDYSTPASYTASGFFLNELFPSLKNGELNIGKAKFALDGRSVPFAYTPAVAAGD